MESEKEPLSFGRYLQAIRLEKKISLEQVSQQTRIGIGNLILIEQEDHERLPAEVYVKGFLRSYAKAVGADGDEVIRRYGSRLDVVQRISETESYGSKRARGNRWKLLLALALFVCMVVVSIIAVITFRQASDVNKAAKAVDQKTAAEKKQAVDEKAEHQDLESEIEVAATVPEKFLLHATAVEETWLKVIIDEKAPAEYNLKPGDQIELEANRGFNLLIGNAGGLNIKLNDSLVSIPGKSGEVVTIELP
jgi:cytoskeletal protein RodZ